MNNDTFRRRVRDLAKSDDFHVDIFNMIKEKHEELLITDTKYKKSYEFLFLEQFLLEAKADKQLLSYFRDEILSTDPEDWSKK